MQVNCEISREGFHASPQAAVAGHTPGDHKPLHAGLTKGRGGFCRKHITDRLLKGGAQVIGHTTGDDKRLFADLGKHGSLESAETEIEAAVII